MSRSTAPRVTLVDVSTLRHIEGYSPRRVARLAAKIWREGVWRTPLAVERKFRLVMDGQHRLEVAKLLGLSVVPVVFCRYDEVGVRSLRPKKYEVSPQLIAGRAICGDLYPSKTVEHRFPAGRLPTVEIPLERLIRRPVVRRTLRHAA